MNGNLIGTLHVAINKVYAKRNLDPKENYQEALKALAEFLIIEGVDDIEKVINEFREFLKMEI